MRSNRFALIGRNISYTRSPDIFKVIFRLSGIEASFEVHDLKARDVEAALRQLMLDGIQGICVTIPYKESVIPMLDDIGSVARSVGAVNSIVADAAKLYGYNTDCYGFGLPLAEHAAALKGGSAIIFGAGGAARAAAHALSSKFDIGSISVCGRSETRLREFKSQFTSSDKVTLRTLLWGKVDRRLLADANIIVNCTPVGGSAGKEKLPVADNFRQAQSAIYYDLNYNLGNRMIAAAREAGLVAIDGSRMLVGQAIRSWDIWTGNSLDFEPVYHSVFGSG